MATWITHMMIVDNLFKKGINLDERGFAVGNIAPDCNVENEDWSEFTPPREVTHWMNGKSKLTADYESFFDEYIKDKEFDSNEHISFLLGYYSHLITDVEFQKFVRDDERVKNIFNRVKSKENLYREIRGYSEDSDTLKKVFGKQNIFNDIYVQEFNYLKANPNSKYNTILNRITDFPDYLDYLPKGAIARKIIIAKDNLDVKQQRDEYIFFSEHEFKEFVEKTSSLIYKLISDKVPVNYR
ncbi:zinc dependent phospholipase C family protein [Inconstantimicrobium mannanitabidum]|uniref:Uncharacterized protein n=1 Tax=Inconstantimicrobium mannanitabidum TaxID=1604901 RepID=A0ACB5RCD6_9CLOT|nr:zinc dependent phospholipase C family protein [Clostridium sp. TW13]GKX66376.1 hypothetical protein rsdtw13_16340 [Clostridium sp. TW13]